MALSDPCQNPYTRGVNTLTVLDTGFCTGLEAAALRGGRRVRLEFHALAFLLEHPTEGLTLFDTGYAPRVLGAMRHFPFQLQGALTPTFHAERQTVREQLLRRGIAPRDVRRVIVSHFHADHVGGLRDFPHSTVVCSSAALTDALERRGLRALQRGMLPGLVPQNVLARAQTVDAFPDEALPHLGHTFDLFGDGSARLMALPGHARGQLGALVQTVEGPVLLAADGCYLSRNYRENRPASPLLSLISDDGRTARRTLSALHRFWLERPEVKIWPTHCPEVLAHAISSEAV